ncbi:putative isomerase YbhE [Calocera cornea HHB12733]|uniref:Putative isomerase YbhE n=1 Tax=Calocera cornea HHB12733 TaxID=1353952 RepID=A0A165E5B4_9BASI|nr:putative isomerase YbhE [Calocera cornea HHB12733]
MAQVQAPAVEGASGPVDISDRIYTGDQSSNTITVIRPFDNTVLGTITLGDSRMTDVLGPQYLKAVNVHGLGFSRDGKYIVSISVTSNTVAVIRTLDNSIVSQTYAGRAVHEAFFAPDNRTVWVASRALQEVDIIDGLHGGVIDRVITADGPSKVLFSPDGRWAYVNHIRNATIDIIDVQKKKVVNQIIGLGDVFSSDMMLSADGRILWAVHKLAGKVTVMAINGGSGTVVTVMDIGIEPNHPNFIARDGTTYVYVTIAAMNETRVWKQDDPSEVPVPVGSVAMTGIEPHGLWPSPDNNWMYVVNEHSDTVDVINTANLTIAHTMNVGQEGQALIYVAGAVTSGNGTQNLGTQGLNKQSANVLVDVASSNINVTSSALITVRGLSGLDMFQVIGRAMKANATYTASAVHSASGVRIPLVDFSPTMPFPGGCETAPQVLAFFKFFNVYDVSSIQVNCTMAC